LPFDAEEEIETRGLNQRTGKSGINVGKLVGEENNYPHENYSYRASTQIGEGVEWILLCNGPYLEFRRTLRHLTQRAKTVSERNLLYVPGYGPEYISKTIYLNEFDVYQDETSYCIYLHSLPLILLAKSVQLWK
jgi:hypothetical protein